MKKILFISLLAALLFTSCEKDTMGVSKVTTYATMTLNGQEELFWPLNTTFVDPGCVALEGETDITSKIEVSSNVNATKGGKYNIDYLVKNSDGFSVSVSRTVYVYVPDAALNGYYSSNIQRTALKTSVITKRGPFDILVFSVGNNNYWVEDMMGGWYYYGQGYGYDYAGTSVINVKDDNTLSVVSSIPTGFGSASGCLFVAGEVSSYDPATKTFSMSTTMGDTPQYLFKVTMSNPTPIN